MQIASRLSGGNFAGFTIDESAPGAVPLEALASDGFAFAEFAPDEFDPDGFEVDESFEVYE
jgi:hypothetical protein